MSHTLKETTYYSGTGAVVAAAARLWCAKTRCAKTANGRCDTTAFGRGTYAQPLATLLEVRRSKSSIRDPMMRVSVVMRDARSWGVLGTQYMQRAGVWRRAGHKGTSSIKYWSRKCFSLNEGRSSAGPETGVRSCSTSQTGKNTIIILSRCPCRYW